MSTFGIKGVLNIKKYKKNILIAEYEYENLITNRGLEHILKMIGGDAAGGINRIVLGSSNIPASYTDTNLYNRLISVNVNKDYTDRNKVNFLATIPENTFTTTVGYVEGGLLSRIDSNEILITRLVFDDIIYQNPKHSLSLSYSLELNRGE